MQTTSLTRFASSLLILMMLGHIGLASMDHAAAEAQIPRWYLDGRHAEYPPSLYLVGLGEGQTPEDAAGLARASVGAQIRVQVESEIRTITREMDTGDRNTFESMFTSATTSRVDEQLQGLEIALQAEHAGRYYSLAALNKQRYVGELRSDLDRMRDRFDNLVRTGRQQIREGYVFAGITSLLDAQNISSDFYGAMSTHNALADRPYGSGDVLGMARMVPEIRQTLTSIRISLESGDQQTGSSGRQLDDPLVIQAVYLHNGQEVPVPNLPLRVEYQDGTEADRVTTESNGKASLYLTALPVRSEINQVTIQPLFTGIPGLYRNVVQNMAIRATYRIAAEERIPLAVIITDDSGQRLPQVEQRIGSAVERLGYHLNDRSGVAVEGSVHQLDTREVEGTAGTQTVVRSELSLTVRDRNSNSVIGSLMAQGTGMSTRNEADALRASYNRMNVDRRELSEVLSLVPPEAALAFVSAADTPSRPARPGRADTPAPDFPTLKIDDLTFEVRSAKKTSDNRVIIEVMIINHDFRDREISFYRNRFSMYDQLGQSTGNPILTIGTNRADRGWGLNHLFITDIPITLTIEFREVHPSAENISLLTVTAGRTEARLRNISLSQ